MNNRDQTPVDTATAFYGKLRKHAFTTAAGAVLSALVAFQIAQNPSAPPSPVSAVENTQTVKAGECTQEVPPPAKRKKRAKMETMLAGSSAAGGTPFDLAA